MPVNQNLYVVINVWTAKDNKALPGANCGHISITTPDRYMSLWPHQGQALEDTYKATFFGRNFKQRPASYKTSYEEDCSLEGLSEKKFRDVYYLDSLRENEVFYRVNERTGALEMYREEIPRFFEPGYRFMAVKMLPANVRIVLYSLDIEQIELEFERLQKTVTGWSMAGSNALTRTFSTETAENCSSLAFRCLLAGGLSGRIAKRLSSTTSSAVSPDDLLRCIVALKEKELNNYPETREFSVVNSNGTPLTTTPLETIKEAFEGVGLHANAENDFIPSLKPAGVRCVVM